MSTDPRVTIEAQAPVRIDLAGGTLDLWPLFLFVENPVTVNLGINLHSTTRVEDQPADQDARIEFHSVDQNAHIDLRWDQLHQFQAPPALLLHQRILQHYLSQKKPGKNGHLKIQTHAQSPAGAGLGGSSSLNVSISAALWNWAHGPKSFDKERDGVHLIETSRDLETRILGVPAGMQDYYGATFGGLQCIEWGVATHKREWLPSEITPELAQRLVLFYSGQSRNSGINNWTMFKNFIEGNFMTKTGLGHIGRAAKQLKDALLRKNWGDVGAAIREEWKARRTLASGISTQEIDWAFEKALDGGASAVKICGAGGGGCFFVYLEKNDPELRAQIIKTLTQNGIRHLPYEVVNRGVEVRYE